MESDSIDVQRISDDKHGLLDFEFCTLGGCDGFDDHELVSMFDDNPIYARADVRYDDMKSWELVITPAGHEEQLDDEDDRYVATLRQVFSTLGGDRIYKLMDKVLCEDLDELNTFLDEVADARRRSTHGELLV